MSGSCSKRRRASRQKGFILMLGALMTFFILVPAAGLAVDAGMMYLTQSMRDGLGRWRSLWL